MRPIATALLALSLWSVPRSALAAPAPLPDSVLAQVGARQVTRAEFQLEWQRVGSVDAPQDRPLAERRRSFLNQLVDKELLTQAAATETYTPTPAEEARLALLEQNLMRQAYYRMMVVDSISTDEKSGMHSGMEENALLAAAETRLVDRLIAPLSPVWDRAVATTLASAFQKLPRPKEEGPGWMRYNYTAWMPPVAVGDTGQALGHSALGSFTVGRFLWHWAQVPPQQRDNPDTADKVIEWARNFLAQGLMDQEARRLNLANDPNVKEAVEQEREIMKLDAYYRAHVSTAVDTSETRLRALWTKNPRAYDGVPSDRFLALWYRRFDDAAAAAAALENGATWDSLLAARYPVPKDEALAKLAQSESDLYRYPQTQLPTSPDTTLTRWLRSAKPHQVFGPRNRAGQWWVYRFLDHQDGKRHTFEEAREVVAGKAAYDDEEKALRAHLDALRKRYDVRVNERALALLPKTEEAKAK